MEFVFLRGKNVFVPVVLVEAFKARRETLRFPAALDAAGTHRTSLCLEKKKWRKTRY